ncbi:MAG: molybdenum cofactor guanylyltransferase MobA [Pseudooceanicola sp.]|nr:molybdenum cofactor guanylyltransferase MobA [Pseudooceanicola sp.]
MRAPPTVILAGGASRRMGGRNKGLALLAGRPLLAHVIDRIAPQCEDLALNSNADARTMAQFGLTLLPDRTAGRPGPLAGILAAMDWADTLGAVQVVTLPGDTPFVPLDLIPRLLLAAEDVPPTVPIIAQSAERAHPVVGLWPVSLRDDLAAALAVGTRRVLDWALDKHARGVAFPATSPDMFFNVNTTEDLYEAARWIGGAS